MGAAPGEATWTPHVFSLFRKIQLFAINKAWIKLSLGGDTLFHVIFVVEYQFCAWNFVFNGYLEIFIFHKHVIYHV